MVNVKELLAQLVAPLHFSGGAKVQPTVLPFNVQYVLQYRGGKFGLEEILSLAKPEYFGLAPYLAIRALDGDAVSQQGLIEEITQHFSNGKGYDGIESIIRKHLIEKNVEVVGVKVAQISRHDPRWVEEKFSKIAAETYSNRSTPVLLSYAALIGLRPFIEQLGEATQLLVIVPKFKDSEFLGYAIRKSNGNVQVEQLSSLSDVDVSNVTIVDDTVKMGNTIKRVLDHWRANGKMPQTVHFRYVDMVNPSGFLANLDYYIKNKIIQLPPELAK
ncbi:hypothetical protein HYX02_08325 [Candidatus Woesearchaeota archaeon]|nr:hypothetical protein [Candidatus Woesearchaeota archaeon]